jgi:hypothetical protein
LASRNSIMVTIALQPVSVPDSMYAARDYPSFFLSPEPMARVSR